MSLFVNPIRYDFCSSGKSSEAAMGHYNSSSVYFWSFLYGFLSSTSVYFDTLMQQAYGFTLL